MKAIRINTIIDPSVIRFDELKDFEGKKAEIIILVEDYPAQKKVPGKRDAAGMLKEYADIQKVAEENTAYEKHVKTKKKKEKTTKKATHKASNFVNKWAGFLTDANTDNSKYNYLTEY